MRRRPLLTSWALLLPWLGAARAQAPVPTHEPDAMAAPRRLQVPLAVLQAELAERFPLRYPLAGLVSLDLAVPELSLLPALNRLRAEMAVQAQGALLQRSHAGGFTVDFALRYEPTDRTLRAHQLKVYRLRFPGLSAEAADLLNAYAPALAEQSLLEVVLHRLKPQETAMADLLGLQPGRITVTELGLAVELVTKPL